MSASGISRLLRRSWLFGSSDGVVVADVYKGDDGLFHVTPREEMSPEEQEEVERICANHPTRFHFVPRAPGSPRLRGRTRISSLRFLRAASWVAVVAVGIALATRHTRA